MKVLGIDPGTVAMGYGVVDGGGEAATLLGCGVLTSRQRLSLGERLCRLFHGLEEIVARYQPEEVAIEEPFVAKNARSALAIGRAQAVAILAASLRGIPVYSYTPTRIKHTVADYGGSDKSQVQEMVRLQLDLSSPPPPSHAADALAVALCHLRQRHLEKLMREQGEEGEDDRRH
jgi:crossover junction endodeoxyribonuclease RuvC